jgi:hypothetical protein
LIGYGFVLRGGAFAFELLPSNSKRVFFVAGSKSSAWVLQKVKEICHQVGLSCEGFVKELMTLLSIIEASHFQKESTSRSKMVVKVNKELKRLSCSINYNSKAENSSRGRVKGRVVIDSLLSLNCFLRM